MPCTSSGCALRAAQFQYGKRHGLGKAVLLSDEDVAYIKAQRRSDSLYKPYKYEGQYRVNKRHGRGVLELLNGDRLFGAFKQDMLDGLVKMVLAK